MKDASFYVGGLLDLQKITKESDRRATWRQSMAALARATEDDGPGPLDAIQPQALLGGVQAALEGGLVDDLEWLEPSKAGAALYELAAALPLGSEKRELGRRVLERLLEGNAEVFVALATRMALGAGKGLSTPAVRARMLLVTEMPIHENLADGPLALALAQRRELAREWIEDPSTGSLPARRFAARLIERAAREAARRAQQGDIHALRAFRGDAMRKAYARLLGDRELLVWRHVAVARGLLAPWVSELDAEIEGAMRPDLSPTEWRRGATSIAAMIAVDAEKGLRMAKAALAGGALHRDAGIGASFVWGAARAAEAEPVAAAFLLDELATQAPVLIAEAVVGLYSELGRSELVDRVARKVTEGLDSKATPAPGDDGAEALLRETQRDLDPTLRQEEPVREQLAIALRAYAEEGARAAYHAARVALDSARATTDALSALGDDDEGEGRVAALARRTSLAALRDLDTALLEHGTLDCLLRLGTKDDGAKAYEEILDGVREQMADWILARESKPLPPGESPTHPTLRLRRLRTLLHLVDSDLGDADEGPRTARLRERWRRIAHVLSNRFENDPPSVLRRTISASYGRALDALVRTGACDVTDALLFVARVQVDPSEFATLSEAAMDPDLVHIFDRYARFLKQWSARPDPEDLPPASVHVVRPFVQGQLAALDELTRELVTDASGRRETVRTVLARLQSALVAVQSAPSLRALSTSGANDPDVLGALEQQVSNLAQVTAGARARLSPQGPGWGSRSSGTMAAVTPERGLSIAVSRVLEGADRELSEDVVHSWLAELESRVPMGLARVIGSCVMTLLTRPVEKAAAGAMVSLADVQLPAWLPASRTLGGFYVQRPLGKGAVGSVFICTRAEDRQDPNAERFALKVPEYSATAARKLSESEFLQLFRAEASALMAVPSHPNLARFVTFDLSARPKPILVMELVEGDMLERVLASRSFDVPRALRMLDDVLAGLEAMHAVGVGHLDLKPSNVVQRKGQDAVLVDFGLAGRHIRPGCATGPYGAPEVWGVVPDRVELSPTTADVYAFGCLAYEALTGQVLFQADSEVAQIGQHLAHDGLPPALKALGAREHLAPLSELLFSTLRRDPRNRPPVPRVRGELQRLAPQLMGLSWPVA